MAIKIGGNEVVNDLREIASSTIYTSPIEVKDSDITNFHPDVTTTDATISFIGSDFEKITLTQNTAFSKSPAGSFTDSQIGDQKIVLLDTGASGFTPSFSTQLNFFTTTPNWSSNRYWTISWTYWGNQAARATAIPYDPFTAPSSSFSNFGGPMGTVQWDSQQNSYGSGTPAAWASIAFVHSPSNNRVNVTTTGGNSRDGSTQQTIYANYTGLTGITSVEVQYNPSNQTCSGDHCGSNSGQSYGPLPTDDGKAVGTYYDCSSSTVFFGWSCEIDSNAGTNSITTAAWNSTDPDFRIKIVCNEGTFYSTGEVPTVNLFTNYGPQAGFGGGGL